MGYVAASKNYICVRRIPVSPNIIYVSGAHLMIRVDQMVYLLHLLWFPLDQLQLTLPLSFPPTTLMAVWMLAIEQAH
ncbi:mitogen-activated protein kinase kinase kinase 13 [Biomphalaria pfeifferi]|uniref:Mitogen-activated protein kinase kinase kinase 13 n=1 Tax=Biomphalaria pfeifferi TaxID=112525 RepID=A0AAD8C262_BIOPF|nr:mitogen-activated protein kinase kinase kinase 13 [Biomphalaria pfeifferi]